MKYFNWFWVDSLLTLLIAVYLVFMGYDLLKNSLVLMLFLQDLNLEEVRKLYRKFPRLRMCIICIFGN